MIYYYRQTKGSHCSALFNLKRWDQEVWSKPNVIVQVMWVDACRDIGQFLIKKTLSSLECESLQKHSVSFFGHVERSERGKDLMLMQF